MCTTHVISWAFLCFTLWQWQLFCIFSTKNVQHNIILIFVFKWKWHLLHISNKMYQMYHCRYLLFRVNPKHLVTSTVMWGCFCYLYFKWTWTDLLSNIYHSFSLHVHIMTLYAGSHLSVVNHNVWFTCSPGDNCSDLYKGRKKAKSNIWQGITLHQNLHSVRQEVMWHSLIYPLEQVSMHLIQHLIYKIPLWKDKCVANKMDSLWYREWTFLPNTDFYITNNTKASLTWCSIVLESNMK